MSLKNYAEWHKLWESNQNMLNEAESKIGSVSWNFLKGLANSRLITIRGFVKMKRNSRRVQKKRKLTLTKGTCCSRASCLVRS